jgi:hypothetical protein
VKEFVDELRASLRDKQTKEAQYGGDHVAGRLLQR